MYKLTRDGGVIRKLATGEMSFSADPNNPDYQEFLRWKKAGGKPEAADPEPIIQPPLTLTQRRTELKALFAKQKSGTLTASEETRLLDVVLGE